MGALVSESGLSRVFLRSMFPVSYVSSVLNCSRAHPSAL